MTARAVVAEEEDLGREAVAAVVVAASASSKAASTSRVAAAAAAVAITRSWIRAAAPTALRATAVGRAEPEVDFQMPRAATQAAPEGTGGAALTLRNGKDGPAVGEKGNGTGGSWGNGASGSTPGTAAWGVGPAAEMAAPGGSQER